MGLGFWVLLVCGLLVALMVALATSCLVMVEERVRGSERSERARRDP